MTTVNEEWEMRKKEELRKKLVGKKLGYGDIAGRTRYYTIKEDSVTSIELIYLDSTIPVWKVSVGKVLSWDLYFDSVGEREIYRRQNFRTLK